MLLDGVRVIDLTRLLPGGYCTQRLMEFGARVLKLEPPGGDPLRRMPGGPAYFEVLHRGKQLDRIDLKTVTGRERLLAEVRSADVLVEGDRPGVMERNQVGYDVLRAVNPGLVYCAITGYGSRGALAGRAGHDLNYLGRAGVLSLMPLAGGVPVIPGVQIADLGGGLEAAFQIAAALLARGRTGKGQRLEVSMTALMRGWTSLPRAVSSRGVPPMALTGQLPCYRVYRARDGWLTVAALERRFWDEFCRIIERPDLADRQFDGSAIAEVAHILAAKTATEWMSRFGEVDACVEPCLTLEEVDGG